MNAEITRMNFDEQVQFYTNQVKNKTYQPKEDFVIINSTGDLIYGDAILESMKKLNRPVNFMVVGDEQAVLVALYNALMWGMQGTKVFINPRTLINKIKPEIFEN